MAPVSAVSARRQSASLPPVARLTFTLVGEPGVGKTSLILAFRTKRFPREHTPSLCDSLCVPSQVGGRALLLSLRDTAGQPDYDNLRHFAYAGADVLLICFALDSLASFEAVRRRWAGEARRLCPARPLILVGTKMDARQRQRVTVTYPQARALAHSIGATKYVECSAAAITGLDCVFDSAARAALAHQTNNNHTHLCALM